MKISGKRAILASQWNFASTSKHKDSIKGEKYMFGKNKRFYIDTSFGGIYDKASRTASADRRSHGETCWEK
jgi:hypothetical protein